MSLTVVIPRLSRPRFNWYFEETTVDVSLEVCNRNTSGMDDLLFEIRLCREISPRSADLLDWLLPDHRFEDSPKGWCRNRRLPRWEVTGEPPRITVTPSINAGDNPGPGNWHGHITDGAMTP